MSYREHNGLGYDTEPKPDYRTPAERAWGYAYGKLPLKVQFSWMDKSEEEKAALLAMSPEQMTAAMMHEADVLMSSPAAETIARQLVGVMASAARITKKPKRKGETRMHWQKTRVVLNVWSCGDIRLTENPECGDAERFRLDAMTADGEAVEPQFFPSLDAAKRAATMLSQLALLKADNERLRIELDERRQADAFGRAPTTAIPASLVRDDGEIVDDGELVRQEEDAGVLTGAF